jgi:hypothetical protein
LNNSAILNARSTTTQKNNNNKILQTFSEQRQRDRLDTDQRHSFAPMCGQYSTPETTETPIDTSPKTTTTDSTKMVG